jgi:hypothetical protein
MGEGEVLAGDGHYTGGSVNEGGGVEGGILLKDMPLGNPACPVHTNAARLLP